MKSQVTFMEQYEINNGFNDVEWCFMIEATPINTSVNELSEEELNAKLLAGEDITDLFNQSNISPFRTILFPKDKQVCEVFIRLLEDNDKRIAKKQKPIYPVINLNRFEEQTPEPYFRRFTTDTEDHKAGDWIIASGDEETLPNDPMNRKVFRSIWITSTCKTDANGNDIPAENVVNKAKRAWVNGLKTVAGAGTMFTPCKQQLLLEERKAQSKSVPQEDGDSALVSEFNNQRENRRKRG